MSAPSRTRPAPAAAERLAALSAHAGALAALTALGAALRFSTLAAQSYWTDEGVTVVLVRQSFGKMLSLVPETESTPHLYYVLAWLWSQVFGTGEAGLRSLSALVGAATIPIAYSATARLVTPRAGLVVAALAAVNPLLVWYSQEARAYALLVLLATASLAVFARLLERVTAGRLAAWAVLCALALATHYFAFFVIGPEAVWLVARAWRVPARGPVLAACGGVVVAGAALMPLVVHQASNDRADYIRALGVPQRVLQLPKQYLTGFDAPLEAAATVVAAALAAYGLWLLARRADHEERRGAGRAAAIALPALALPVVLAIAGVDYLITRNLIAAWVPTVAIIASGLGARQAGRAGAVATAALCAVSLALVIAVDASPAYQRGDWRGIAKVLGPVPPHGRALVVSPFLGRVPLALYTKKFEPPPSRPVPVAEIDVVAVAERRQGQTPQPPRPAHPLVVPGWLPPQVIRSDTYTIVRYRARRAAPAGYRGLRALKIAPGVPAVVFQAP